MCVCDRSELCPLELLTIIPYHTPSVFNLFTESRPDLLPHVRSLTQIQDTLHLERIMCPAAGSGSTLFVIKENKSKIDRAEAPFPLDVATLARSQAHKHPPNTKKTNTCKQVTRIHSQSKGCDKMYSCRGQAGFCCVFKGVADRRSEGNIRREREGADRVRESLLSHI